MPLGLKYRGKKWPDESDTLRSDKNPLNTPSGLTPVKKHAHYLPSDQSSTWYTCLYLQTHGAWAICSESAQDQSHLRIIQIMDLHRLDLQFDLPPLQTVSGHTLMSPTAPSKITFLPIISRGFTITYDSDSEHRRLLSNMKTLVKAAWSRK